MLKLMVVDDSPVSRSIISRVVAMVTREPVETTEAGDGEEALTKLANEQPDLLITDLQMPNVDGETLVSIMSADDRFHTIPVVVMSSSANYARRQALRGQGARYVLKKPVTPIAMATAINALRAEGALV